MGYVVTDDSSSREASIRRDRERLPFSTDIRIGHMRSRKYVAATGRLPMPLAEVVSRAALTLPQDDGELSREVSYIVRIVRAGQHPT